MRNKPPTGYKRVSDWVGKYVETTRSMRNGMMEVAEGTRCKVTRAFNGLALETDACPRCGVRVYITGVGSNDVRLLHSQQPTPDRIEDQRPDRS